MTINFLLKNKVKYEEKPWNIDRGVTAVLSSTLLQDESLIELR